MTNRLRATVLILAVLATAAGIWFGAWIWSLGS
jgi:hypothetical protein